MSCIIIGVPNAPFTKVLIEVHRSLKILDPGKPPEELKSRFLEQLFQQVAALTNMGAALQQRRKPSKEEKKVMDRMEWARGAKARILSKQQSLGLPPPKDSHEAMLTQWCPLVKQYLR